MSFISVATAALSAMLQRLLERDVAVRSSALLESLIQAHTTIVGCPESLAVHMGSVTGVARQPLLQVNLPRSSDPGLNFGDTREWPLSLNCLRNDIKAAPSRLYLGSHWPEGPGTLVYLSGIHSYVS
jgi:hypothetical protein